MLSSEREEHVVECWPPHLDIEDIDAGIVEGTNGTRHRPVAGSNRSMQMSAIIINVDIDIARCEWPERVDRALQVF